MIVSEWRRPARGQRLRSVSCVRSTSVSNKFRQFCGWRFKFVASGRHFCFHGDWFFRLFACACARSLCEHFTRNSRVSRSRSFDVSSAAASVAGSDDESTTTSSSLDLQITLDQDSGAQGRTQHSSKVANEPPAKNQPAFFFFSLFAFSHRGLFSYK